MWIKEMCGDGEPLETFAVVGRPLLSDLDYRAEVPQGHGRGAALAARLACKQPDRVKKVVLVEVIAISACGDTDHCGQPWGMGAPKASEADVRFPQKSMPSLFPSYFVNNEVKAAGEVGSR